MFCVAGFFDQHPSSKFFLSSLGDGMAKVFISYSRESAARIQTMISDLAALGHAVWYDRELTGGQAWWDAILENIRNTDVFIFAVDNHSLASPACQSEYQYADSLGLPILPALVGEGVSVNLMPAALQRLQLIDLTSGDRDSALALARAIGELPPRGQLPDPLPQSPEAPMSYLGELAQRVAAPGPLSREAQGALVIDLKVSLRDPETAVDARILLQRLGQREDILNVIYREIEDVLEQSRPAPEPQLNRSDVDRQQSREPDPEMPVPPTGRETGPWPGTDRDATLPPVPNRPQVRGVSIRARLLTAAAFIALGCATAWVLAEMGQDTRKPESRRPVESYLIKDGLLLFTIVLSGLAGLVAGARRRIILVALGIAGSIALFTVLGLSYYRDFNFFGAVIIPLGALFGAVVAAVVSYVKRRSVIRSQAAR